MNVTLNKTDNLNGVISIEMERADFQGNVVKELNQYRRKASIPGFRPGKVPMGVVKKLYGAAVLTVEVNRLIYISLSNYIQENKLPVLGDPLPKDDPEKKLDLEKDEQLTFEFEIGLAPEFDITFDKEDALPLYKVTLEDELLEKQIEGYKQNFGTYDKIEESALETDLIKGKVIELEDGETKEDGIVVEKAILMPSYIKNDEETKNRFVGANAGDEVIINPKKAYDNEAEIASFLNIKKEDVADITSDFKFIIEEITRFKEAELNQEMFDKVLGEGVAEDEGSFRAKIKESLSNQFAPDADYFFMKEVRKAILEKMEGVEFPEAFLKKWLKMTNEQATDELIEQDFPNILDDIKYQLAKQKIVTDNDIKTEASDVQELASQVAQSQFAQYGMRDIPAEMLQDHVKRMLENVETVKGLFALVIENKIAAWVKESVTIEEIAIASEDFSKLAAEENQQTEEAEEEAEEKVEEEVEVLDAEKENEEDENKSED